MKTTRLRSVAIAAALLAAGSAPTTAAAQSQLDVAEASGFLGTWVLSLTSDMGAFNMNLEVTDQSGKVAAYIVAPEMGPTQSVTDITKLGESLVLAFAGNYQGTPYDAAVTLEPAGEELSVWFEINQGEFAMGATGARTGS